MTTLKDIAEIANVSLTTVSRALSDKPDIGPETKKKINELARKLKYIPNDIARGLAHSKSFTLGISISDLDHPLYGTLVQKLGVEARRCGYTLLLVPATRREEDINLLLSKKVDGIIFGPTYYRGNIEVLVNMKTTGVPFVVFGGIEALECDTVGVDREGAVFEAVNYLIEQGRTKIAYLCVPDIDTHFPTKLKGFERAIRRKGLVLKDEWLVAGEGKLEEGYEKMKRLLADSASRPDAVFCHNDFAAIGAIRAIQEKGLAIPRDIAVVGFDGIPESGFCYPSLTTIVQPVDLISVALLDLLVKRIQDPSKEIEMVSLKAEFIKRQSA